MRVAVVWNEPKIDPSRQLSLEEYRATIRSVVEALHESGHETLLCEGDRGLPTTLERFMPAGPQARPSGMVFNRAYGSKGQWRSSQVPSMLEMAGIPYTGASPLGAALELDKVITKKLIRADGVPTPNFCVMTRGTESAGDLRFPLIAKPRYESDSLGLKIVHEPSRLRQAVEEIVTDYSQDAIVEEYIDGREISVALLGNEEIEVLPPVEHDFGDRETRLITWEDKHHKTVGGPEKVCPAQIEGKLATMLRDISIASFRACLGQDYGRVDLRIDRSGQPFVLEINFSPSLNIMHSYVRAATAAGYSFPSLVNRILDLAHTRYFGIGISGG
ncbi:D-alanine-D-alanine ligase [Bradyrhizobium sp. USDA 4461]